MNRQRGQREQRQPESNFPFAGGFRGQKVYRREARLNCQRPAALLLANELQILPGFTAKTSSIRVVHEVVYGREMYETWCNMTVTPESGLDISPVITHHLSYKEFEKASKQCAPATAAR